MTDQIATHSPAPEKHESTEAQPPEDEIVSGIAIEGSATLVQRASELPGIATTRVVQVSALTATSS